jgi:hypothetical protein
MKTLTTALVLLAGAVALEAQARPALRPEVRPFVGASLPTGAQRDLFSTEPMIGVQVALEERPTMHILGTFTWVPGRASYGFAQDRVNILQYSLGAEFGYVTQLTGRWELRPFIGAGAGGRTYAFQATGLADRTCFAGYLAAGTEVQVDRVAFRFEARDNVYCYRSPVAGQSSRTRSDIGLALGVAYHIR